MKSTKKFMPKIKNFTSKHWLFSLLFGKLSGIWFSLIITYFGEKFYLIEVNKTSDVSLTSWGIIATIGVFIINCCLAIIEKYGEIADETKNNLEITTAQRDLFHTILNSTSTICRYKMENQLKQISNIHAGNQLADHVYTEPCTQLKHISDQFIENLAFLASEKKHVHEKDDFQVHLLYNFPKVDEHHWENAESFSGLITSDSCKDTLQNFLKKKESSILFNSKQKAFEDHFYEKDTLDEYDTNGKLNGSIACFMLEYYIKNEIFIRAVLVISTRKKQIIDVEKLVEKAQKEKLDFEKLYKNTEKKMLDSIDDNVFKHYIYRYGIELCNYYIQYLHKKQNGNGTKNSLDDLDEDVEFSKTTN